MLKLIFSFLLGTTALLATAQAPVRQLPAKRTVASFKIDGELSEAAWKDATPANNFIEWRPTPGKPENPATGTEVYILYSNTSIFVGGFCHERTRDSVSRDLVGRDVVGINDFVGVIFDTYNDKINAFGFYVTPYGEQFDAKYSSTNGEDGSWSGVWNSAAKIRNDGWTFEMEIPYSALRFVSKPNQTWGINLTRKRNKSGQQYMWNPVDPQKNGFINQEGEWTGIEQIKPPLRLSFSPYLGVYASNNSKPAPGKKAWNTTVTGGMDVKYGISDAFTLDMTLIPDFGQVRSDNIVLNISPFEQRYQENRPFFTEGTELFNKGNLFYSRRVGSAPIHFGDPYGVASLRGGEVLDNPEQSKLINATKFSGRTSKGLGIGVFNAVQRTMYATVVDSTGKIREKVKTGPLTNYNVLVFDQTLKNNSSVSFINTNVLRDGEDPDANVSAFLFDINNKKNTYNWNGNLSLSNIFEAGKTQTGYAHTLGFGKTGGRFNFNISQEFFDDKYDKNDLGYQNTKNYLDHYMWIGYRWTKPTKHFNNMYLNFNQGYSTRFRPAAYQSYWFNVNANGQLKNLWYAGIYMGYNADGNDFYEARNDNEYKGLASKFITQSKLMTNAWFETNSAKKYKVNVNAGVDFNEQFRGHRFDFSIFQRYRFSDRFTIDHNIYYNPWIDNAGWYGFASNGAGGTDVLFSRRNRNTIENTLNLKYSFSNRSFLNFRARHYWSDVEIKELYDLQADGTLKPTTHTGIVFSHQNFNLFNIDATYTLQFAPGSFLNINWKNQAIDVLENDYLSKYGKNLGRTFDAPQLNNFSVKVIYYLDYLNFRKWSKKKQEG